MTSDLDLTAFTEQINAANEALQTLKAPAQESADAIEQAFSKAGTSITRSLSRAASDGKITLSELASAILAAINAAALETGGASGGGLGQVLGSILSSASQNFSGQNFSGARAEGGPVLSGGSYLVGERGPELFRPASSGVIETGVLSGPVVNIAFNLSGGPETLVRSEAQIASALSRAARLGLR
jgi:phage-related minor tail protein